MVMGSPGSQAAARELTRSARKRIEDPQDRLARLVRELNEAVNDIDNDATRVELSVGEDMSRTPRLTARIYTVRTIE